MEINRGKATKCSSIVTTVKLATMFGILCRILLTFSLLLILSAAGWPIRNITRDKRNEVKPIDCSFVTLGAQTGANGKKSTLY